MAFTATPVIVQTPKIGLTQILPADTTAAKTVIVVGANGAKVTGLIATSTDTAARTIQISVVRSAVSYLLGSTTVAIAAGTDGTNLSSNLLSTIPGLPIDNDGQSYLYLETGDTLTVASTVTVTAAKAVSVLATFGNF